MIILMIIILILMITMTDSSTVRMGVSTVLAELEIYPLDCLMHEIKFGPHKGKTMQLFFFFFKLSKLGHTKKN